MIVDPIADLLGTWATEINICSILLRVAVSVVMGMLIGCERSSKRHAAGLRTFMLVSLACTIAVLMDLYLGGETFLLSAASVIAIAIITVNSVLFTSRNQIKGLTTSVGLWACRGPATRTAPNISARFFTVASACLLRYKKALSFRLIKYLILL